MLRKIPRTMSTQHPDNACAPLWCRDEVIEGDAEVYEAYFAYNDLGCHEVMWDSEGKDADTRVIRKLLTNHGDYFKENVIGRNVFLTYRIPNPRVHACRNETAPNQRAESQFDRWRVRDCGGPQRKRSI